MKERQRKPINWTQVVNELLQMTNCPRESEFDFGM